jgi:hypothetical protein
MTATQVNSQLLDPRAAALNENNHHGNKQYAGNNSNDHDTVHNDPLSQKSRLNSSLGVNRFMRHPHGETLDLLGSEADESFTARLKHTCF